VGSQLSPQTAVECTVSRLSTRKDDASDLNYFYNNTDVDLVAFGGTGCAIAHNDITHDDRHGIAGIHIRADEGMSGLEVWDNDIYSAEDLLEAGLVVGPHPWDSNSTSPYAGQVFSNYIDGAVINLVVDGIEDGAVTNNYLSRNRGSAGLWGCSSYEYAAGHFGSATIQTGYTSLVFDGGYCHTP
jgi:hypothetical protein